LVLLPGNGFGLLCLNGITSSTVFFVLFLPGSPPPPFLTKAVPGGFGKNNSAGTAFLSGKKNKKNIGSYAVVLT
jgi:hypothetical protein